MLILKVLFLLWALWLTPPVACGVRGNKEMPPWSTGLWAIGVAGFITCQWLL